MIEFMVIGLPRSGTAWIANWLTTDTTTCIHDPLAINHYRDLDSIKSEKMLGISCTALWAFPDYVNSHKARKVIVHRNLKEINSSLSNIGLPQFKDGMDEKLSCLNGIHIWKDQLFKDPEFIYEYLTGKKFDRERFETLKELKIERKIDSMKFDIDNFTAMQEEMRG